MMTISWFPVLVQWNPARRTALLVGCCIVASLLAGGPDLACAGTGGIVTLPLAGTKIRSGLKIQVDSRWVDGTGYRPVRVRVSSIPPGPAPADRSIEITLRPRGWQRGNTRASVTQTVELAQGAMYGDATMAVPHYEMWNGFEIETTEDGDLLKDLSVLRLSFPMRSYYNWSEATPSIVVLSSDAPSNRINSNVRTPTSKENVLPDIRALAGRIPLNSYSGMATQNMFNTAKKVDDDDLLRLLIDLPRMEILPPSDLPDRWIELSCIDIMVLSFDELERIVRELPATWRAMRDWQASGATICVFGVGEKYQRLADLEKHLAAAPLPVDDRQPHLRGWTEPSSRSYSDEVDSLVKMSGNVAYYRAEQTVNAQGMAIENVKKGGPPDPQLFVMRDVHQGAIVAMHSDNPFPGEPADWAWLLNSLSPDDWMWYRRHGVSMHRENAEYWDLLIPGVGEAPVNSFLVLITLFVVIIGPVNYFLLQRQRRLYLMLVTVPLGAVVVTGSLLIYALLTDGLGVRMRMRSETEIDQRSGQVVSWSRQSYYAGLTPSDGLTYPRDAAVYPVVHRPIGRMGRGQGRNQLIWDSQQRLASGFLTSRTTKQFLVVETRQTTIGLTIDESADPPRVTNRLGTTLDHLIVRTSGGGLFAVDQVAPAATVGMAPITGGDANKQWNKLLADNRPKFPEGFNPYQLENAADFFGNYNYSQHIDQGLGKPSFKSNLPARRLRALISVRFSGLKPRSYLASVAQPVEVSVGIEGAREEAGFHLVTGRW